MRLILARFLRIALMPQNTSFPSARICLLGGTNLAHSLTKTSHIQDSFITPTPFGPSPRIYFGEAHGVPFYHIPLHGLAADSETGASAAGTEALLRTWSALHQLGVKEILGGATAGAINKNYQVGDYVVSDDFIDFNIDRPRSIATQILGQDAAFIVPRYIPATDPDLDRILISEARQHAPGVSVHAGGICVQAPGGRFETKAEIRAFALLGGDLVTMNVPTEIAYARQLGMNFSSLIAISNPAEGLGEWNWKTLTDLYPVIHAQSTAIYLSALPRVAELAGKPRAGDALRLHPEF